VEILDPEALFFTPVQAEAFQLPLCAANTTNYQ
jgi:hypothetical protein